MTDTERPMRADDTGYIACPLLVLGQYATGILDCSTGDPTRDHDLICARIKCVGSDCAWWRPGIGRCAIALLGDLAAEMLLEDDDTANAERIAALENGMAALENGMKETPCPPAPAANGSPSPAA